MFTVDVKQQYNIYWTHKNSPNDLKGRYSEVKEEVATILICNKMNGWMNGWMDGYFTSFSTVFQSYQDDGWMVMKAVCNEILFMVEKISP